MKEDKPVIDCNNGWSRAALRILVLLIPYWLLVCPAYLFYVLSDDANRWQQQTWYGIPLFVLFPVSFLFCSVSSYLCLTNKILIKKGRIFLPPPRYGSYPADALLSVSLNYSSDGKSVKSLVFNFQKGEPSKKAAVQLPVDFDQDDQGSLSGEEVSETAPALAHEIVSIDRIAGKEAKKLLQMLERFCPRCVVDGETKVFLLGRHAQSYKSAVQSDDKLEIEYHSHERIKEFVSLIKSYESYFWKVYISVCMIPLLIFAPALLWFVPALIARLSGQAMSRAPLWFDEWFSFFGRFLDFGMRTLAQPGQAYFELMMNPVVALSLLGFAIFGAYRFARFLLQPNRLTVYQSGFSLDHMFRGAILRHQQVNWSDFTRVSLQKPKGTTTPEQWQIAFHRRDGKLPVTLMFSAIKGDGDREQFLGTIEKFAPHLTRDHELIEAFTPAQKQSYTELWLQSLTTPPKRERLAPLTNGQVLKTGRYVITEQLGTGGQGVAYLGTTTDKALPATIVVKEFVLPVFVDKSARRKALEKFEHEAVLLQGLDHQRVVKLLDYFIEDHRGYLVLEHINGCSLRKLVEENGPLASEQVLLLAEQMCDILSYLHALQPPLVHRDFTPDNLILNSDNILKLIDFNVVHQKESHTSATVVGKHAYLPPEQFRGKPVPQSDIYAMGASLHFLLTGEDPEPVSVSRPMLLNEHIDARLDALVSAATELDTKKRFADAAAVLKAVREISGDNSESAGLSESEDSVVLEVKDLEVVMAKDAANG